MLCEDCKLSTVDSLSVETGKVRAPDCVEPLDFGLRRKLLPVLTIRLSTLVSGYSSGFSALALPSIKQDMRFAEVEVERLKRFHQ